MGLFGNHELIGLSVVDKHTLSPPCLVSQCYHAQTKQFDPLRFVSVRSEAVELHHTFGGWLRDIDGCQ